MVKLFATIQDLAKSEYVFRIMDSGPGSLDRITVAFCDGSYLALSHNGLGFSQWGESLDPQVMSEWVENKTAVDLALGDLSQELQNHILYRVNEAFSDALSAAESLDPKVMAVGRENAIASENPHDSAGKGIYHDQDGKYWVRMDGDAEDDRGPYDAVREAFAATLPDAYCNSGPEYHSPYDVARLTSTPGIAEKIAEMEGGDDE